MREQHTAAIGGIDVQPHPLSIRNSPELAHRINCPGVRGAEDAHDAQRPYAAPKILRDCRLKGIQPHPKFSVGRERTQRCSAQPHGIDCLVD